MPAGRIPTLMLIHVIILAVYPLNGQPLPGVQATEPSPQQTEQPATEPPPSPNAAKRYAVSVTVLTGESPSESPVKGAGVTIFVGDHKESVRTGSDGGVLFKFETTAKTATIRVVADHFVTVQKQVTLKSGENDYRIVLKKAN